MKPYEKTTNRLSPTERRVARTYLRQSELLTHILMRARAGFRHVLMRARAGFRHVVFGFDGRGIGGALARGSKLPCKTQQSN